MNNDMNVECNSRCVRTFKGNQQREALRFLNKAICEDSHCVNEARKILRGVNENQKECMEAVEFLMGSNEFCNCQ